MLTIIYTTKFFGNLIIFGIWRVIYKIILKLKAKNIIHERFEHINPFIELLTPELL